jgi:uncharacterized protein YkwD/uncharacterized membrane protein required for colicin V production
MITDIIIILALATAIATGFRRGLTVITVELGNTLVALALALLGYIPVSNWLRTELHLPHALGELAAFAALWVIVQLLLLAGLWRWRRRLTLRPVPPWSKYCGAVLNFVRGLVTIALLLIVFNALPLSASDKHPVTDPTLSRGVLAISRPLQNLVNGLFGQDLADTLTYLTVSSDPESTERIELGFTTTNVTVDTAAENQDLALVNHERTSRGGKALTMNTKAQAVGIAYGKNLLANGYFSHIGLDGSTPFTRMTAGGVQYGAAGENLALAPTLAEAHTGLMNSPGHKANILNPAYRTVGIAVIDAGQYGLLVVQDFTD